jgi:hypothetical protein
MAYLGRRGASAALTSADIPDNSITAAKIVADTIAAGDIADDAVGTAEIADDAVTGAKLANDIAITTTGALTGTTGDLNWDSNTLVVDSSESRVGIGTATPAELLEIAGTAGASAGILISDPSASTYGAILKFDDANNNIYVGSRSNGTDLNQITIKRDSGYVGIGTTAPDKNLHVKAAPTSVVASFENTGTSGQYGIYISLGGNPNNTTNYFVSGNDAGGNEFKIYSDGSFSQASDRRIKENIVDVESMLDKVNSLRVVNYNRINDESKGLHIGTVAQEVEEIFPHLITVNSAVDAVEEVTDEEGNITTEAIPAQDERYMMYKIGLVFPLIKAVQELSAKVTTLENA